MQKYVAIIAIPSPSPIASAIGSPPSPAQERARAFLPQFVSKVANYALIFVLALRISAPAYAVVPTQEQPFTVIRALDKMTARVEEIELPVGKTVQFGTLSILSRTCRITLPEETPPESAAYLEVEEFKPAAKQSTPVFTGWMFASSPALSAMEHPVYDIWVTGCRDKASK